MRVVDALNWTMLGTSLACVFLALFLPVILTGYFSIESLQHAVLSFILTLFIGSLFRIKLVALILAWMIATMDGAVIGGFAGTVLGYVSASLVLRRVSPRDEIDLKA